MPMTISRTLIIALALGGAYFAQSQSVSAPALADSGGFDCLPAPCVLQPTQASEGGALVTDSPIATNPLNGKQLLLGSTDYNCGNSSNVGLHLSEDGGSTWARVECMPVITGKRGFESVGEPSVGYDQKGNAYASGAYSDIAGMGYGLVAVQRSRDGGTNWSKPVIALQSPGNTNYYLTHLSVDASPSSPWEGAVYVSGVLVSGQGAKKQVMVSHSTDGGDTWTQVAVGSVQKYPAQDVLTRTSTAAGGSVYLTWVHCSWSCRSGYVTFSRSADGGNTWSSPQQIATVRMPPDGLPNTFERVYNYPSVAVDNSDGPYAGTVYVVMYTWTGSYMKVQVMRSTDGGTTWSKPMRLAPRSDTHDQFFPSISVSSRGKVGVSWLDRRNDPNDVDYQAFAAISEDGGQSFSSNWQLTTAFSNPKNNGTGNNWMGDYTGNTWAGETFNAAWMDSSNGVDMQEVVGGVRLK
jgi:BNR/Asp-box repeat